MRRLIKAFPGGIALWGAVPAIYDTTLRPLDRGIHVHARAKEDGPKDIDATWRAVRLIKGDAEFLVTDLDAIYFMVTSIFQLSMKQVTCTECGYPHLDKDWFSVHPHRRHLCAGCGKNFRDTEISIGNPICGARELIGVPRRKSAMAKERLKIRQADFPGGIQVWGSNPSIMWTSSEPEREGIHVHAFTAIGDEHPVIDETYSHLAVDGINLDARMVRTFMAQSALPHLEGRVTQVDCARCASPQFDEGSEAFAAIVDRSCRKCGGRAAANGRLRKVVANPIVGLLGKLAETAPRPPRKHELGLLPETL